MFVTLHFSIGDEWIILIIAVVFTFFKSQVDSMDRVILIILLFRKWNVAFYFKEIAK